MEKAEGINMYYSGYEILKRSINNNELQECLRGNGKYRYQDKNDPGPVNQSIILDSIYKIYEKEPDVKIDILFQRSLCDMINSDVEGIYICMNKLVMKLKEYHHLKSIGYYLKAK